MSRQKSPWTQVHGLFCVELTRYTIPVSTRMKTMMTGVTPSPPMKPEVAMATFSSHCGHLCTMMNLIRAPTLAAAEM